VDGLRSNWGGGNGLYATMGGMVTSSWQPKGQWWIYKRYADQTGLQATVTAGSQADAVAYLDSATRKSIIVVGNKGSVTGTMSVKVTNIPADLQGTGPAQVLIENMPDGTAAVSAPTVVSNSSMTVTGNALTVPLSWSKAADGYAVTLMFGNQDGGVSGRDGGPDAALDAGVTDLSAGGTPGSGGSTSAGGTAGSGASNGAGGTLGFGGSSASGGMSSSGGSKGTGGAAGAVGSSATGGISGGTSGLGGTTDSSGAKGSGGTTSSTVSSGGNNGPRGGATSQGGTTTENGAASGCGCMVGNGRGARNASSLGYAATLLGVLSFARTRRRSRAAARKARGTGQVRTGSSPRR
jgi:hypothetical protein